MFIYVLTYIHIYTYLFIYTYCLSCNRVCVGVSNTSIMRMYACFVRTYLCVRVFVVKTMANKETVHTYIYVCVCMYVCIGKLKCTQQYPSAR